MAAQESANPEPRRRGKAPETDIGFPPNLGRPATRTLHAAGYTRLDQLADVAESELLARHGFGPKGTRIIREALQTQEDAGASAERG